MVKARNTFAKRQREADRKRRVDQKKERRLRKKHKADETVTSHATSEDNSEGNPGLEAN